MKSKFITIILLSGAILARGQGSIVWDQQATGFADAFFEFTNQPMGQPFTPSFSSIGVAQFLLSSGIDSSDIEVNLRSGSITGSILGTSLPTTIPGATSGTYALFFANPIQLTPGTQYFLQPFTVSGTGAGANLVNASGSSGGAIVSGATRNGFNFWFQEGIVVPEPSLAGFFAVSGSIAYWRRRKRRKS